MPYIDPNDRLPLNHAIEKLAIEIDNGGELNYTISRLIKLLIDKWGERYTNYEKIVGALMCIMMELYRKRTGPYEDKKEIENGTIWD